MKRHLTILAAFLTLGLTPSSFAQEQAQAPPDQQNEQQPGPSDQPYGNGQPSGDVDQPMQNQPGVARVSFIHGSVSTQRGDNGDWVAVTLNAPIMAGDRISTGPDGKGELQLDWADIVRLSSNAEAKVVTLDRNNIKIEVGQGLVMFSVLQGSQATVEIDTPNAAIHPNGEGEYRISVDPSGQSILVVRRGSAEVSTPQGSTHVDPDQMITVQGTDNPQYKIDPAPAPDDWDSWNDDRDRVIGRVEGSKHTNQYYVGSQDLDSYGTWTEVPDYGQVWVPRADSGWAPYRDGRWVWEPYYGWTWVSYEPWGWAPYHYGRWFVYGGNWAWWPGPIYGGYYPVWSPAYVSFFGWGGGGFGFGVGFGFGLGWGHVGWLPCGPGDWYHPWWGRWGGGYGRVGFDHVNAWHDGFRPLGRSNWHQYSNFNEAFRNDRIRGGISSMDGHEFGRGAVPAHQERINEGTLRNASMSTGRMPMQPSHESYSPTSRAADPRSYRNAPSTSQHFFSASRPNGTSNGFAGRNEFNSGSRPMSPSSTARPAQNFGGVRNGNSNGAITSSRPGWHTFTPPNSANTNRSFESNGANGRSPSNGGFNGNRPAQSQGGYQRYNGPSSTSRGYSNGSYGRPSLNMRQPIVTPRSNSPYGSSPYGGSRGYSPNGGSRGYSPYNAPRGNYNAPRPSYNAPPRPSYSAPRSNTAPRSYSAPRSSGGGGSSRGSGGGSHPSGGSSHGSGGGSHGRR